MKKFKALIFRELRLSVKNLILKTSALMVMGLFYLFGIYVVMNDEESSAALLQSMVLCLSIMFCLMSVLLNLGQTDILKSDINSRWLNYSYCLPIKPKDRAIVHILRSNVFTTVFLLLGLIFTSIYCHIANISFSVKYITLYAVVYAVGLLCDLLINAVVFRARSIDELNKLHRNVSLALIASAVAAISIFYKDIKHFLNSDSRLPVEKIMDHLNGKMLFWLVPLIIILIFADYLAVKKNLQTAYSHINTKSESSAHSKETITDTHDYPIGFFYKELKQNRLTIILTAVLPTILILLNFGMLYSTSGTENKGFKEALASSDSNFMRYLCMGIGAFVASGMLTAVFTGDDRKLWTYFTVSTPQGVKGFLYNKYVLCFAMNGLYMVTSYFAQNLYDTIYYAVTGKENIIMNPTIVLFYALLALCAIDIPFMIRFGQKKGSIIKTTAMMAISTVLVLIFELLPYDVQEKLMQTLVKIKDGTANDTIMLMFSLLPAICIAAYLMSYRVSCKLFMKGVDEYDK